MEVENRWSGYGNWTEARVNEFSLHLDTLERKITYGNDLNVCEDEIKQGLHLGNELELRNNGTPSYALTITVLKATSLLYRIKTHLRTKSWYDDPQLIDLLKTALRAWKEVELFPSKELTENDQKKIKELCVYDLFAKALLKNARVKDECFKLIFRDNFPVKMLVQYFKTCSIDLKNALLHVRVGFFHNYDVQMLKITKTKNEDGTTEKDLQLKINRVFVSILDDEAFIPLNGGITHTWKKIKGICAIAKKLPAQMEMFQDEGLILFRPQGLKYYLDGKEVAVDTKKDKYWESPEMPVFLTLSQERLEKDLNVKITEEQNCVATIEATCIDPNYVKDAHGASTIYLPQEDGSYRMYPCGKYAKKFPQTAVENACFVGNTVEAEFTYPDPTSSYTQRIHGIAPHVVSFGVATELLKIYGKDIWHFQFGGNNCSAEFQLFFEAMYGKKEEGGTIPNYFRQPLLETRAMWPINYIFEPIYQLPAPIASIMMHGVQILLGSKREYTRTLENGCQETESLYKNEFTKTQELYVPGRLVTCILAREINGVVKKGINDGTVYTTNR